LLCCHLPLLLMVVRCAAHLQQGFCLHETFCASERLVPLTLPYKGLLKFSMCCGGTVTEFNTKNMAYRCTMFRASTFMTTFTNTSWHVKHLLRNKALHRHANASGDGRRTKVKGCLVLEDFSIALQLEENKFITL
jgi:hypothetical protein